MHCYRRVTYEDRVQIKAYIDASASISVVAQALGFHKATIYRELKRNSLKSNYSAKVATSLAVERFKRCRRKVLIEGPLQGIIDKKVSEGWAPLQLAGRLRLEGVARVSHETIYRYLRKQKNVAGLRRRKKRGAGRRRLKTLRPEWMKSIHDRPQVIDKRKRFGDWERDTMFVKNRKPLLVCTERKSRYTKIVKPFDPWTVYLPSQTKDLFASLNRHRLVRSITNDNGSEFKDGYFFEYPVYYSDPRSPHQRGSVENAIGLIRQYIPKTADITKISLSDVEAIENKLNQRPRRCLGYLTPHEVYFGKRVALVS